MTEAVARALYDHEMASYDPADGTDDHATNVEAFWLDPEMRAFWIERARIAISTLAALGVQVTTTQEVMA